MCSALLVRRTPNERSAMVSQMGTAPAIVLGSPRGPLANMLAGQWVFDTLVDEEHVSGRMLKAIAFTNLRLLWDAVQAIGWQTHTGDWDWDVLVKMVDGREYENTNVFPVNAHADAQTACVDYAQFDTVTFEATRYEGLGLRARMVEEEVTLALDDIYYIEVA